ncbi:M20/M25/M40 family metallo-hydrolase [Mesorhizobium neociceri]|uniref:M20/M25/M40 family metallo-hydrolase n=1 Tax=Mesorhizobium neociceri TaxID=1307853 RepID=A0A838BGU4_9HYPH|nr:M20/M25/M40 family metallo-hydrolase [Mesorhizobium neociceri]MBA1145379.1 M20/M25/M40 family metallo-hydrolase [Mesorhizobium neociceri]
MHVDTIVQNLLSRQSEIVDRLCAFLRLPSVSTDPAFIGGMLDAQAFLVSWLERMGLSDVQLLDGGGHPAVYGAWNGAPGKPTLLIYGHYDVQPPDPAEAWVTPPFEPTIRDGRLYARGASDVKGSTAIALETIAAFLKLRGACPVNVKVFLEGEEETNSPSLRPIVQRYGDLLQADGMISADGARAHPKIPTINVGSRGIVEFEISIRTADKDLHSGRYGGAVRNAAHEMAKIIASLHDEDGAIAIPGLLAALPSVSVNARADTARFPFDEAAFVENIGARAHGEHGFSIREQLTLRPALDVNGMWGGYTGFGSKTVIPSTAHAKLSLRIVPGQDPDEASDALKAHLCTVCPRDVELSIDDPGTGSKAFNLPTEHPLVLAAKKVLSEATGQEPALVRLGASIPITVIFQELLGLQTLMFGFALPDEDIHAPNEFFRLASLMEGLSAWPRLLEQLGEYSADEFRSMAAEAESAAV